MCFGFTSIDLENVYFAGSADGGETWTDGAGWIFDSPPELPDIDGCGDGRFMGTMVPSYLASDGSVMAKVEITDAIDTDNGYTAMSWDWYDVGAGYTNFIDMAVGGYTAADPSENEWAFGGFSIIGDHGELGSQSGFFSYQNSEGGNAWIYTLADNPGDFNGCESTSMDIDQGTLYSYAVYTYDNEGAMDIYVFIMDFGQWGEYSGSPIHENAFEAFISSSGDDANLDVSALNDNVIIVSERDGDIIGYYSGNGLNNIEETTIETGAENPRIVHTDENTAICTFIKNDILYSSTTEDGGASWSSPTQISGPEEVVTGDICGFGAVYESEDIVYFAPVDASIPIIEIGTVSGGIGVSAIIKNTGSGDATDVSYSISATGGILGKINKVDSGTITVTAGGQETISLPMLIGLGKVTIDVTAGSASETVQGTQILVYTMI